MGLESIFSQIGAVYGRHRLYFNAAGATVLFFMILFDVLQALIMNLLVFVFMSYQSLELLSTDEPENAALITMLQKWATYGVFLGMEVLADNFFVMFPLSLIYPFGKMLLYLWVIDESSNANTVYTSFIAPLYSRHRPIIIKLMKVLEAVAKKITGQSNELITDLVSLLKKHEVLANILNSLSFGTLSNLLDQAAEVLEVEEEKKED